MAEYWNVSTQIWTRPEVQEASADAKLIYIYLWTNERRTLSAIYPMSIKTIADQTGIEPACVSKAIEELSAAALVEYDYDRRVVWVIDAVKSIPDIDRDQNKLKNIVKNLSVLPDTPLIINFLQKYSYLTIPFQIKEAPTQPLGSPYPAPTQPLGSPYPAPTQGLGSPWGETENETEKETETEKEMENSSSDAFSNNKQPPLRREEGGTGGETRSPGCGKGKSGNKGSGENGDKPGPGACHRLFEQEFGRPLSPLEAEQISELEQEFTFNLVREALRRAVAQGARRIRYIRGILENWRAANLRTIQEVLEYEQAVEEERARKVPGVRTREPPPANDPAEKFKRQQKKREETVRAAVEFLRLKYRGRLPPREEAAEIARGYGEEFVSAILEQFYQFYQGSDEPP
ncbi:MAG: DnaD domain protein [Bacillota bacterium]